MRDTRLLCRFLFSLFAAALTIVQASACPCSEFKAPANVQEETPESTRKGLEYTKTSKYKAKFDEAVKTAYEACKKHLGEPHLAIVSDLDETLLDNRPWIKANPNEPDDWPNFSKWANESKAPVLKPTADFIAWARKNGYAIFFITGRQENLRAGTIANLVKNNIAYDGLFLRPDGDKRSAVDVKSAYREGIEKIGFKIIVNIGDQPSDLLGGHAEECVLVPNEMYSVR